VPKNESLVPVNFPMSLRFNESPTTEYKNVLDAINVVLIDWPDQERALRKVYQFINATWEDEPGVHDPNAVPQWKWTEALELALQFKALPTVLETLDFTFRIEGIDVQTVTHLIRHRTGSFSAQCTGDRWQTHAAALVPGSVQNSPELYERWKKHVDEAKQLYVDMIDTKKISIMDARTVLPKCLETHYYVKFNLKDLVAFVQQRMDKQIQTEADNVISYQMLIAVARVFPSILSVVNMHAPSMHYVKTARTGKATNLYWPDADSDKFFDWHPKDFIYQGERDEVNGTDPVLGDRTNNRFKQMQEEYDKQLVEMHKEYANWKSSVDFGKE